MIHPCDRLLRVAVQLVSMKIAIVHTHKVYVYDRSISNLSYVFQAYLFFFEKAKICHGPESFKSFLFYFKSFLFVNFYLFFVSFFSPYLMNSRGLSSIEN